MVRKRCLLTREDKKIKKKFFFKIFPIWSQWEVFCKTKKKLALGLSVDCKMATGRFSCNMTWPSLCYFFYLLLCWVAMPCRSLLVCVQRSQLQYLIKSGRCQTFQLFKQYINPLITVNIIQYLHIYKLCQ